MMTKHKLPQLSMLPLSHFASFFPLAYIHRIERERQRERERFTFGPIQYPHPVKEGVALCMHKQADGKAKRLVNPYDSTDAYEAMA